MKVSDIRKWWRSGSWDYVVNSRNGNFSDDLKVYHWKHNKIYYRAGMADAGTLYEILIRPGRAQRPNRSFFRQKKLEYWIPQEVNLSVILDIGGNIGVTSVYYSTMFPQAKIFSFEPVPANFEVLKKNAANSNNIMAFNFGLGDHDGEVDIYQNSDELNTGGFSIYEDMDVNKTHKQTITLKKVDTFLKQQDITSVDLIKIDTESAEFDILTTLDQNMLSKPKWITGELHGKKDFEVLAYLSQWLDIDVRKSLRHSLFGFHARNKNYADIIPWRA